MKLALVSPLPPLETARALFVADLARRLAEQADVQLLVRDPAHAAAELVERFEVRPCADLPHLLDSGAVDLAVHVLANDAHYAHQTRFVREAPGLLVLLDFDLSGLSTELTIGPATEPVCGLLARSSLGVLTTTDVRDRLGAAAGSVPVRLLPEPDAAAWAAAILEFALSLAGAGSRARRHAASGAPGVEVVIVAYNSRRIIEPCLRSVRDQDYPNFRCTVIDNASADGTAEYIGREHPWVDLVASPENLGFAGGNNLGFERSEARYIAILNQDAVARRDWLTELVRVAELDERIAMVGSKMMMLRCPTIFNSTGICVNRIGFPVDRQIGEKDEDPSPVPQEVFGACGGAALLRRSVLAELGGFDEKFFMYFEDMDLSWRMWLAGYRILYAPLAVVHHDWHGDLDSDSDRRPDAAEFNEKTARRRLLCERNRLQTMLKNYSLRSLLRVLPEAWRYDRWRRAVVRAARARGETPDYFRMVERGIRSAWRWNLLHLPSIWRRRRATQRHRVVADSELARLLSDWRGEPSFIGDLEAINDRHSARPVARIVMGETDRRCLGPGWYGAEPRPDLGCRVRWTKQRAWLYLGSEEPAARIRLRLATGPVPVDLSLSIEMASLGSLRLEGGALEDVEFELPRGFKAGGMHEVRLDCQTFRPCDHGMGPDTRELGVLVAEVELE